MNMKLLPEAIDKQECIEVDIPLYQAVLLLVRQEVATHILCRRLTDTIVFISSDGCYSLPWIFC